MQKYAPFSGEFARLLKEKLLKIEFIQILITALGDNENEKI